MMYVTISAKIKLKDTDNPLAKAQVKTNSQKIHVKYFDKKKVLAMAKVTFPERKGYYKHKVETN